MSALDRALAEYSARLDDWLRELFDTAGPADPQLAAMVAYHLGWLDRDGHPSAASGALGKRIRPALTLLVCESLGGRPEQARGAAAAVELIHNFSLVHDDIQDESALRRSRATVWHIWGTGQGINVGDLIFALAQVGLVRLSPAEPEAIVRATELLNRTCVTLVEGQYLDLAMADITRCTLDDYFAMIERKTGALIALAGKLGALFAGAPQASQDAFAHFGRELGLAFQLQDDVLGVWGDEHETGKPADSDIRSRKKALPAVLALSRIEPAAERLRAIYGSPGPMTHDQVAEVRGLLDNLGIRQQAESMADEAHQRAVTALNATDATGRPAQLLHELCESLTRRRA